MTDPGEHYRGAGRPGVFAVLLSMASLILLGLLILGPALPMAPAVGLALIAVAIVATAWIVAGPRW